jgi:uncharacterized membrane protein
MTFALTLALLWAVGIAHDFLWTYYIAAVAEKARLKASLFAFALTAFGYLAWEIIVRTGGDQSITGICAYAFGGACGTYISFDKTRRGNDS